MGGQNALGDNAKVVKLKPGQVLRFDGFDVELPAFAIATTLVLVSGSGKPWVDWDKQFPHIGKVVTR